MTYLDVPITLVMEFVEKYGSGVDKLLEMKVTEDALTADSPDHPPEDETPDE